jgi:hypothetical protein
VTVDLNTVLPDLCFFCQLSINDNGQISGTVLDLVTFVGQAVILTPGAGGSQNGGTRASAVARSSSRMTWKAAEQKAGLK